MFLIKRLYTLLYMLLTASTLLAQRQPIFDASGKLTSLKGSGNTLATFDVNTLKEEDKRTKKAARQQLIKKIDATIRILSTPTYKPPLIRLYSQLWDTAETIKYLGVIRKALNNQDTAGLTGSLAFDLLKPLKDNLLDGSENIFSAKLDTPQKTKISLSKKDPFNAFVIDYYNKTIGTFPPDLTLDKKIAETNELLRTIDSIGRLTRPASNQDMFDETLYNTIKTYDDFLHSPQSILSTVKGRFKAPWFRQWFWFRGGEVTLNPLDFTTAGYLANNPSFDASKAALLDRYMDSIVQRQIRYDTAGMYNSFIEKLRLLNTGDQVFSFTAKNDSLLKLNEAKRDKLLLTSQQLNSVIVPSSGIFFNVSAVSQAGFDLDPDLKTPLHTTEKKVIALHNVQKGRTGGLTEADKPIADKSTFQQGLDTTISQLGALALLVGQLNPFAGFLNFFSASAPYSGVNIPFPPADVRRAAGAGNQFAGPSVTIDLRAIKIIYSAADGDKKFTDALLRGLSNHSLLDASLFNKIFANESSLTLLQVASDSALQARLRTELLQYLRELTAIQIRNLQEDSIFATQLLAIYQQSTLPEKEPLEGTTNDTAVYATQLLETHTSDDAIEKTVDIYTAKGKDTTHVSKFSYKVGKNYRFKLGAGIAYTLNSYNQSDARLSGNQIVITNDVRQYRFIVGINFYLGAGLFTQDNSICKWTERNSIFLGVGIPNPLGNIYLAYSHDIVPGLKLSGGIHVAQNNKYLIQNDIIVEQRLRYQVAGPFLSITIDPASALNLLNVFKKP